MSAVLFQFQPLLLWLLPDATLRVFSNVKTLIFKKLFQANSNLTIQKWENWPISSVFSKHAPQISTPSHDEGPNIRLVSFHEQLENWTKYRKQLFSDIKWCVAQDCDLWEEKNNRDEPRDHSGLLFATFRTTV